jgi:toxin ParE1/3/4
MRLRWLPRALDDLEQIHAYIANENEAAADRTAQRIVAAIRLLAEQPKMGRRGRVTGTRELVVSGTPFIVPYRLRKGDIEVLRIFHGAMRWPRHF